MTVVPYAIFVQQDGVSDYRSIAVIEHYERNGVQSSPKSVLSRRPLFASTEYVVGPPRPCVLHRLGDKQLNSDFLVYATVLVGSRVHKLLCALANLCYELCGRYTDYLCPFPLAAVSITVVKKSSYATLPVPVMAHLHRQTRVAKMRLVGVTRVSFAVRTSLNGAGS
ncbi:hypothetical protein ARMGADRAFT_485726 [Armillaria gallica]|uniref:Uncharacterized protein n=1 Tax=Armillaria gallica TaxID=47427 RepID=A0A2H3DUX1_ARMGA|nr:hypothetical protein ARMGADRAFT_485726 [Armillaria gallica]